MKAIFFIAILSWQWYVLNAQSASTQMGARANGMAYASSCLVDEWSLFNNVGALSKVKNATAACAYDVRSVVKSANRTAALLVVPLRFGVAGIGAFRFGDDLYSEQVLTAGFGNTFGITSLGVKINYIHYRIQGFGSKGVPGISFGGLTQLTRQLSIGVHIVNINQPVLSELNEQRVPTLLVAGLAFKPTENIFITTEVEKDLMHTPTLKTGIEYAAHKKIHVRTGFNLHPNAGFFGLGFKPKHFLLDYAFRYDPVLGSSHQASVGYKLSTK